MTLNPGLLKLILKYNNFHSVDASFKFYPELELVDLSSNQLVSIPDRSFSSQRRLVELRLEHNKISGLGPRTFSGLGRLEVLRLGHNLLDQLGPARVFRPLKQLRELGLGQNRIRQISGAAFSGLTHLTILDLSDNLLEAVPGEALAALPSLAELNLSQNNIRVLADSSFSGLLQLSTLDMSGNKLERVHEKAFTQLQALAELNLSDNELYQVPSHTFASFDKLERLNIGQNKFSAIDEGAFLNLQRLKELHISGCPNLVEVAAEAFAQLADLQTLTLSSNRKLSFIHPQAFGSISGLRSVDLSNNGLASVSSSLLAWTSLTSVDLSGNPWQCDCDLSFLQTAILTAVNRSEAVRVVRCWNPPNLRDRDVTSLDLDCSLAYSTLKTDKSAVKMNNTELIAILCSSAVVITVILIILILKSRKRLQACFNSSLKSSSKAPVSDGKILQYSPYQQEPRYVSYQVVQTLHRPTTNTVIINPHTESLVRQENYFLTLKDHEKLHYLSDLESDYAHGGPHLALVPEQGGHTAAQQPPPPLGPYSGHMEPRLQMSPQVYTRARAAAAARQYPDESIYQRVDTDDPVSDI